MNAMTNENQLDTLIKQEQLAVFDHFTEEDAFALGMLIRTLAIGQKAPVAINIRTPDRVLFHSALIGTVPDNDHWVRRKSNTTFRTHQSSMRVGESFAAKGRKIGPEMGMDPMDFAAHGGSFPIRLKGGGVVAVVTVSGLASIDDHRMIITALSKHLDIELPLL